MADKTRETTTWVGLEVGGVNYALNIQHVREIIRPLPMQVLPHAGKRVGCATPDSSSRQKASSRAASCFWSQPMYSA